MTFSEQIVYGWFRPARYKDMIELPRRRFVAYVIVMMLVLSIVDFANKNARLPFQKTSGFARGTTSIRFSRS